MEHSYNPFFGITRSFKLTLAQRFKYAVDVFGGTSVFLDGSDDANVKPSAGIFDYLTGLLAYFLLRALYYFVSERNGFAVIILGVINIPFIFLRFVFIAVAVILATPIVLLTHAVFCVRLWSKSFRNRILLELCTQDKPNIGVINMLIARGVDSSVRDSNGNTCLDLLASKDYPKLNPLHLLLEKGEFVNIEHASKCLNILVIFGSSYNRMMCHYDFIDQIEIVYSTIKTLLEKGAKFDKSRDFHILNNRFSELIEHVIKKTHDYAFGILIILNAPIENIKHLGKSEGNDIEKLIYHLSESQNLEEDLVQLQKLFNEKNIQEIENMPIKDFCSKFSPKFSTNEGAGILSLLCSGRVMQKEGYERIDPKIDPLPKLPVTIWGEIAKRMVNKDSPTILFEVDVESICKKIM